MSSTRENSSADSSASGRKRKKERFVRVSADDRGVHLEMGEETSRAAHEAFYDASRKAEVHLRDAAKHVTNAFARINESLQDGKCGSGKSERSGGRADKRKSVYSPGMQDSNTDQQHAQEEQEQYDLGDAIWSLIACTILLGPVLIIAILMALGPFIGFLVQFLTASVATATGVFSLLQQGASKKARSRVRYEIAKEWGEAGKSLFESAYQFSRPFGFGILLRNMQRHVNEFSSRYDAYLKQKSDVEHTPDAFRAKYHVVDQLPGGGSGARIYVVRRVGGDPGELYVLKNFDAQGGRLENLIRENQAVALARRLGLVIDSEVTKDSFYYVMPYYRGDTLTNAVIKQYRGASDERVDWNEYSWRSLGWVHQLLQIIAQFHEAGVFHKDIKPDNLICEGDRIHLVDIGLLTPLESVQQLTTHGTEYFRDPEMVRQAMNGAAVRDVDAAKFDIYAIGAVLYFLFEGDLPTSGSLSRLNKNVPRAVKLVIQRAMAPFDQRYSSARQMLADLDKLCFAASHDALAGVKPGDLPSFRTSMERDPVEMPATDAATTPPPNYALSPYAADRRNYGAGWGTPDYAQRHPRSLEDGGASFKRMAGKFFNGLLWLIVIGSLGIALIKVAGPVAKEHLNITIDGEQSGQQANADSFRRSPLLPGAFENESKGPQQTNDPATSQLAPQASLQALRPLASGQAQLGPAINETLPAKQPETSMLIVAEDLERILSMLHKQHGLGDAPLVVLQEHASEDSFLTKDLKSALLKQEIEWLSESPIPQVSATLDELSERSPRLRWMNTLEAYEHYLAECAQSGAEPRHLPLFLRVDESQASITAYYPGLSASWILLSYDAE